MSYDDVSMPQKIATVCAILALGLSIFQCGQNGILENINSNLFTNNTAKAITMMIMAPITMGFGGLFAIFSALSNGGKPGMCAGILGFLAFATLAVHMGIYTETLVATATPVYNWRFGVGWAGVFFYMVGMIFSCVAGRSDSEDAYNY